MRSFVLTRALGALAAAAALAAGAPAAAQEAAPQLQEDPRAVKFREVERGLFVTVEAGFLGVTKTPVSDPARYPYACLPGSACGGGFAPGLALTVDVGWDFSDRIAASIFGLAGFQTADASYGSFRITAAGAAVRWSFLGFRDANDVERLRLFLRGRAGYAWSWPEGLFGTTDVLAGAGVGLDYDTRLRHFAVGLAVDALYLFQVKVPAFDVMATLRYTF
jgi:hypothetical protein